MDDLLRLADQEGIVVEYWDFTPPLEAVYWWAPGLPPVIGLAHSLERQPRAYQRCILAEELGHHFTTAGDAIPRTFFHYRALERQPGGVSRITLGGGIPDAIR